VWVRGRARQTLHLKQIFRKKGEKKGGGGEEKHGERPQMKRRSGENVARFANFWRKHAGEGEKKKKKKKKERRKEKDRRPHRKSNRFSQYADLAKEKEKEGKGGGDLPGNYRQVLQTAMLAKIKKKRKEEGRGKKPLWGLGAET